MGINRYILAKLKDGVKARNPLRIVGKNPEPFYSICTLHFRGFMVKCPCMQTVYFS